MTIRQSSRGVTAVEVMVAVVVVVIITLYLMLAMPRGRETARRASCQKNLMQIGMALELYTQSDDLLPQVRYGEGSPLAQMLNALKQPDFLGLTDRKVLPRRSKPEPGAHVIKGFMCPSDPSASDGSHPAPINYRVATGDTPEGLHGAFEPGKQVRMGEVGRAKGTGFTAAFSERLVGNGRGDELGFYSLVQGPVDESGCPAVDPATRRNDAGSSWMLSNWTNTLYQHNITPNATPSCVASDGKSARMGASSAHAEGVHLLMLDGSAKIYRASVDPTIWRGLANMGVPAR